MGTGVPACLPWKLKIPPPLCGQPAPLNTKIFSALPFRKFSSKIALPWQTALEVVSCLYTAEQEAKNNDSNICTAANDDKMCKMLAPLSHFVTKCSPIIIFFFKYFQLSPEKMRSLLWCQPPPWTWKNYHPPPFENFQVLVSHPLQQGGVPIMLYS